MGQGEARKNRGFGTSTSETLKGNKRETRRKTCEKGEVNSKKTGWTSLAPLSYQLHSGHGRENKGEKWERRNHAAQELG